MASGGSKSVSYPVVVSCLSRKTTEKTLFYLFKEFGLIIDNGVTVMKDKNGISKGFGYVNYKEESSAKNASLKMNGKIIEGSVISTLYKGKSTKEAETDYKKLTDCIYFIQGECKKQDCPYRHVNTKSRPECTSWMNRKCKNVGCEYAHSTLKKEIKGVEPVIHFEENTVVNVNINKKNYQAIVRWCGTIPELGNDKFVGIEIDQPIPEGNDGTINGKRYFSCSANCGFFISASRCKLSRTISSAYVAKGNKSSNKMYICCHYLNNLCVCGEDCEFYHPPYCLPFCWIYKNPNDDDDYKICSKDLNVAIEKAYGQVSKDKYESSNSEVVVDFDKLSNSKFNGKLVSFERTSTRSSVKAKDDPYVTVWHWYYLDMNNVWSLYSSSSGANASNEIELQYQRHLYLNGCNRVVEFATDQFKYQLDFVNFTQTNIQTGTKRAMRRRATFLNFDLTSKKKSERSGSMEADFPSHWSKVSASTPKLISVPNDVRSKIERHFTKEMGSTQILSVEELVNKDLYIHYAIKKKQMEKRLQNVNEKQLWHGTSAAVVISIMEQNFDWRLYRSGVAYGNGSYFAKNSSYSHSYTSADASGVRSMFYADVLVGEYAKGSSGMPRPPVKSGQMLYDSCVDNTANPTIFVIFNHEQYYPRYLLKYK